MDGHRSAMVRFGRRVHGRILTAWAILLALHFPGEVRASGEAKKVQRSAKKPAPVKLVKASWYGARFHGKVAANGRLFDARRLTAAHRSWRLGSKVQVRNPRNGKAVVVEITDRGPYVRGREIDLSYEAAARLGILHAGVAPVEVEILPEEVSSRQGSEEPIVVASASRVGLVWPRAIAR